MITEPPGLHQVLNQNDLLSEGKSALALVFQHLSNGAGQICTSLEWSLVCQLDRRPGAADGPSFKNEAVAL